MANHKNYKNPSDNGDDVRHRMQRKVTDGNALRDVVQAQAEADAAHPVTMYASLLDIVTAFAPIIRSRKNAKWTDAEICAWLAELGYEIDRQTLRAYRSQLGILVREPSISVEANISTKTSISSSVDSHVPRQTALKMRDALSTDALQVARHVTKAAPRKAITTDDLDDGV
jgi:hypothetical protein